MSVYVNTCWTDESVAAAADEVVPALVVFVDGVRARLLPLTPSGRGEEVLLESAVEGRHQATGWAMRAPSRYQRHIEEHRGQHDEAVAAALTGLAERHGVQRIVLAGEARAVAVFRAHLPTEMARRVVGVVAGAAPTLEAVNRIAVQRLYLVPAFQRAGALCERCRTLQPPASACRACGGATRPAELGEAMVGRVLASGGSVSVVERHAGLVEREGVGAPLRYAA